MDASICLIVGLVNISRIDSFRSDFFRAELFRPFARLAFLFGFASSAAIRSVTPISHSITHSSHTPARTGSQRTWLADSEADIADGLVRKCCFRFRTILALEIYLNS